MSLDGGQSDTNFTTVVVPVIVAVFVLVVFLAVILLL